MFVACANPIRFITDWSSCISEQRSAWVEAHSLGRKEVKLPSFGQLHSTTLTQISVFLHGLGTVCGSVGQCTWCQTALAIFGLIALSLFRNFEHIWNSLKPVSNVSWFCRVPVFCAPQAKVTDLMWLTSHMWKAFPMFLRVAFLVSISTDSWCKVRI